MGVVTLGGHGWTDLDIWDWAGEAGSDTSGAGWSEDGLRWAGMIWKGLN